ncbi:transposase [Actinomadura darangshiensis]|uniref:Transposase n=1 Tax=Actinomadura darangshiensis TaxID=705336 RepID=A0A4V2YRY2_9ACTN|nr:IS607 family element RNA-guided endonuclease TnpB [Actinomadura darangshiensis]TDD68147.1 transposase [Actinomadura darangshiensis]
MDDLAGKRTGERIQVLREHRGLTRPTLAGLVGRSASWLKGIENGRRLPPRLPILVRLAEPLGVGDVAQLAGTDMDIGDAGSSPLASFSRIPHAAIPAVREAVRAPLLTVPETGVAVPSLAARVAQAWCLWHGSATHRTDVGRILPALVRDARIAARAAEGEDRRTANAILSDVYALAQAYRYALDPTPAQERALLRHAGAARVAYNWGLARVKATMDQRAAERSYGITGEDLTPVVSWSMYSLRKDWNRAKHQVAPWWAECSKEAYASGLTQLADALKNWADSRTGKRTGRQMGFPRFKSRRRTVPSVRFTTGTIRVEDDRRHLTLPRLGAIKTHESTRKLHRRIAAGTARILSATVRREAGRWLVSFTCDVERADRTQARPDAAIGVDLGVKHLAVFSDGRPPADNPRHLATALGKLRRASRALSRKQGPDRRTGKAPSNRWLHANAAHNRIDHHVAAQRRDAIHKLTTGLAREYGTVVVEDLNVAGMVRNRRLARALSDAGFGEIRRQLGYKTGWNGGQLVVADRWFPSSKRCSGCGAVKPKLPLRIRTYLCEHCGLELDRDENAALNLARPGKTGTFARQRANHRGTLNLRERVVGMITRAFGEGDHDGDGGAGGDSRVLSASQA